jgi:hypothetical protein
MGPRGHRRNRSAGGDPAFPPPGTDNAGLGGPGEEARRVEARRSIGRDTATHLLYLGLAGCAS